MKIWQFKNVKIRKYTNVHVKQYECEECQRVCKESQYLYKSYKVTSNKNVNKERNKPNKEKIYKTKFI